MNIKVYRNETLLIEMESPDSALLFKAIDPKRILILRGLQLAHKTLKFTVGDVVFIDGSEYVIMDQQFIDEIELDDKIREAKTPEEVEAVLKTLTNYVDRNLSEYLNKTSDPILQQFNGSGDVGSN